MHTAASTPADGAAAPTAHDTAAVLAGGYRWLKFPRALEQAFDADCRAARGRRLLWCNLLGIGAFAAIAWITAQAGSQAVSIRLSSSAVVAAQLLLLGWLFLRRAQAPAWQFEAVTTAVVLLAAGYGIALSALQAPALSAQMSTGGLFLVFMYSGLVARQRFWHTLAVSGLTFCGYAWFATAASPTEQMLVDGHLRLFGSAMLFTLSGNYLLERRERRVYLLRRLERAHQAELTASAERLRLLATSDPLTGVANRRRFDAELQQAWAAGLAADEPLALLLVDIDFFKRFNDRHGHPAGDACLQQVAAALGRLAQQRHGLAARVGGEEFGLLLPGRTAEAATHIAEQLLQAVRALDIAHGDAAAAEVTVSIGCAALWPQPQRNAYDLYRQADEALYRAKHGGRNRVASAAAAPGTAPTPPTATAQGDAPGAAHGPQLDELDDPQLAGLLATVRRLAGVVDGGHRWLRFPADLEAGFAASLRRSRRRVLPLVGLVGLLYLSGYIWFGRPMFADVADTLWSGQLLLDLAGLGVVGLLLLPLPGWVLEGLFGGAVTVLGLGVVAMLAPSRMPTMHSYALSLALMPMFAAVVAAQPLRFAAVSSVAVAVATAWGLHPGAGVDAEAWRVWFNTTLVTTIGTAMCLVAGYLLEHSTRREYLLRLLEAAQREALQHNARRLQLLATRDPLTGLANRRAFETALRRVWRDAAIAHEPVALLVVDVDHFKHYNDGYGHPAGDRCLRQVAQTLASAGAEAGATVARLGGEEFALLMAGCTLSHALQVADGLRAQLTRLGIEHRSSPVADHVTLSVGAACLLPGDAADSEQLLAQADAALYRAKRHGRNRAAA